jgi:hypothetical protein
VLNNLADLDMVSGDYNSARRLIAQGIALSRVAATDDVLSSLLALLAQIELDQENMMAAQSACTEAIRIQIRTGVLNHVSGTLIAAVAGCASAQGEIEAAALLCGAAHAVSDHAGIGLSEWVDPHEERLRNKMSEPAFKVAFWQGSSLRPREALKVALAWSDENAPEGG